MNLCLLHVWVIFPEFSYTCFLFSSLSLCHARNSSGVTSSPFGHALRYVYLQCSLLFIRNCLGLSFCLVRFSDFVYFVSMSRMYSRFCINSLPVFLFRRFS
ncbi:hypothetical protein CSKR_200962 [Clonorchis sinensis]|uniref:Uncharacterized protein n=1 Tax=Clonorchis sinensis TaxID=79923 RepID=A0A8T1MJ72_CLOSI|nr:hypothetical protein CSKR_200962 [Clonorchis sinensis]